MCCEAVYALLCVCTCVYMLYVCTWGTYLCAYMQMCVFVAVWHVLADVCRVLVAFVFTCASIVSLRVYVRIQVGICGLYLWYVQMVCETVRSVIVRV